VSALDALEAIAAEFQRGHVASVAAPDRTADTA
jgi:hypothetical protein